MTRRHGESFQMNAQWHANYSSQVHPRVALVPIPLGGGRRRPRPHRVHDPRHCGKGRRFGLAPGGHCRPASHRIETTSPRGAFRHCVRDLHPRDRRNKSRCRREPATMKSVCSVSSIGPAPSWSRIVKRKTPSLSLRLRVGLNGSLRRLFGACSVLVRHLFAFRSVLVRCAAFCRGRS
jgi:hypothetical protein